ncbi:hypothetical protein MXL79_08450 [Serratia ureilytica]|uniref:hypothetical protein n=1 Tax=Serratia ureilytica TaxID=300181 RepID=UPI002DB74F3C|nr:hypothetical protein [Serratia ureilytica]MEB5993187.1 hypothetical protein [Serratia ureilytica]
MMMDFVVFGHGHDGSKREDDYNGEDVVEFFAPAAMGALSVGSTGFHGQPLRRFPFKVYEHKSLIDGKVYMLAIADGVKPEDVDLKILKSMATPKP